MLWVAVDGYYEKWDEEGTPQVRSQELPEGEIAYSPEDWRRQLAKMHRADFLLALHRDGFLTPIETFIASPDASPECKILWNNTTMFHRNDPLLNQMAEAMGYTDAQIDAVFGINLPE